LKTSFLYPGAIQYYGPDEVCNLPTKTLRLESPAPKAAVKAPIKAATKAPAKASARAPKKAPAKKKG
jgi:hypothetical protein